MATAMRLKRTGRANDPSYRVVVIDSRKRRDGRETEAIGWYDPKMRDPEKQMAINADRAKYWLGVGAQPSATVRRLLERAGIV